MGLADNEERRVTARRRLTTPGTSRDEFNAWRSNPVLNAAVQKTTDMGLGAGDGDAGTAYMAKQYGMITNAYKQPPPPPPRNGSGGSGGGSGDGGAAARQRAAAEAAIRTMFQQYNRAPDTTFLDQMNVLAKQNETELGRVVGEARQTGTAATDRLRSLLAAQSNPYDLPLSGPAAVAANPLTEYMRAGGADTSAVEALRSQLEAQNSGEMSAAQRMQEMLRRSYQSAADGRLADVEVSRTAFDQQLANQQAAYMAQMAAQQTARQQQAATQQQANRDAWMQRIVQMAVENGLDLGKLGVTF